MPLFALGTQCLFVISITFGFQAEDGLIILGDVLSILDLVKTTSKENLITLNFQRVFFQNLDWFQSNIMQTKPRTAWLRHLEINLQELLLPRQ